MPQRKPRVKAPRQRTSVDTQAAGRRRRLYLIAGGAVVLLAVAGVLIGLVGFGGSSSSGVESKLQAAGCTLQSFPAVSRKHITDPNARPKQWNSFPPTNGPHYVTPAVYGFYNEPLQLARVLHNLEHGAVYMLYGSETPSNTTSLLRSIYDQDPRGLLVAPLPELGDTIALGAWTSDHPGSAEVGTGHLAKCTHVDQDAFDAFIKAYRGRGPEGESLDQLQPGST
jgi:hypothetical protein